MTVDVDTAVAHVPADVLKYQGIRREDPLLRIALRVCERYGLDLLLGHVSIIETRGGARRVYVTRDGYQHLAVSRDLLDGVRIVEEYQTADGVYVCVVWLNVRGREHPFEGRGYCDPGEPQYKNGHGRDQARARAERRALRWVVPLDVVDVDDEDVVEPAAVPIGDTLAAGGMRDTDDPGDPVEAYEAAWVDHAAQRAARVAFNTLDGDARARFLERHMITDVGAAWPASALTELLDEGGTQ
jgi:hypothetical protein